MTEYDNNAQAWDAVSHPFNEGRGSFTDSVDYGPFCPLEEDLGLLGSLDGQSVLDAGCGGGQNAVCMAKLGAQVTAVDSSACQLAHAERLADESGLSVDFVLSDIATLTGMPSETFDHILCANVLPYIANLDLALRSLWRVLCPNGQITISMDHPMRTCFMDSETSELSNYPERDYPNIGPREWRFGATSTSLTSYDRTVSYYIDSVISAGLVFSRFLEPPTPAYVLDDHFPIDGPLASLRNIPHTLLIVAQKSS